MLIKPSSVVLDPAVGLGKFPWAIYRIYKSKFKQVDCFEIDATILSRFKALVNQLCQKKKIRAFYKDFLSHKIEKKYDAIIANPPYIIYKLKRIAQPIMDYYSRLIGAALSPMTNIYNLFLLKSIECLKPLGRLAFIIPKEFLSTDYGTPIKQYLIKRGLSLRIILFDNSLKVFSEGITTSCLILIENISSPTFYVKHIKNDIDWNKIVKNPDNLRLYSSVSYSEVNPSIKWHTLGKASKLKHNFKAKIGDFFRCSRGIATGANAFFLINETKRRSLNLNKAYFKVCITKSNQIQTPQLRKQEIRKLINSDQDVYLLDINIKDVNKDKNLASYIKEGTQQGVDKKYLPSQRKQWYSMENMKCGLILIGTFFREGIKVIKNQAHIPHLTCFHGLFLKSNQLVISDLVLNAYCCYFLTNIAYELALLEVRRLGDGLNKLEPRDAVSYTHLTLPTN